MKTLYDDESLATSSLTMNLTKSNFSYILGEDNLFSQNQQKLKKNEFKPIDDKTFLISPRIFKLYLLTVLAPSPNDDQHYKMFFLKIDIKEEQLHSPTKILLKEIMRVSLTIIQFSFFVCILCENLLETKFFYIQGQSVRTSVRIRQLGPFR